MYHIYEVTAMYTYMWFKDAEWLEKLAIMFSKAFYFPTLIVFQDGVYIKGLYLQGAGWDKKNACLIEAEPMQLVCPIPTIHFKPVESKKRSQRGKYNRTCEIFTSNNTLRVKECIFSNLNKIISFLCSSDFTFLRNILTVLLEGNNEA